MAKYLQRGIGWDLERRSDKARAVVESERVVRSRGQLLLKVDTQIIALTDGSRGRLERFYLGRVLISVTENIM